MFRLGRSALSRLAAVLILFVGALAASIAQAGPSASFVMDARTGQVLHSENADTRVHPASLTKMMTLYIAFQAIENGDMRLDTPITVTAAAAAQPPSRLGLREGQKIQMQYLIRAAAVKSANDAATAIGIGIAGSEAAFAERMNATARAMGMNNTRFRNLNGLTLEGHYSSARDLSILGRHLIYDFPQYYNIFSRRTADAGVTQVRTTNSRYLDNYEGADGIKTGYTQAAGYNLTASAERGNVRVIATVLGATSGADRHTKITRMMNIGFERAPNRARLSKPDPAPYFRTTRQNAPQQQPQETAPSQSLRPLGAPEPAAPASDNFDMNALIAAVAANTPEIEQVAAAAPSQTGAIGEALRPAPRPGSQAAAVPAALAAAAPIATAEPAAPIQLATDLPPMTVLRPTTRPGSVTSGAVAVAQVETAPSAGIPFATTAAQPETLAMLSDEVAPPPARPGGAIIMTTAQITPQAESASNQTETVSRLSTSGGAGFGINIGRFDSTYAAERELMRVAMMETSVLSESRRTVLQTARGYDAAFMGLNRDSAELACQRLQARGQMCFMIGG